MDMETGWLRLETGGQGGLEAVAKRGPLCRGCGRQVGDSGENEVQSTGEWTGKNGLMSKKASGAIRIEGM